MLDGWRERYGLPLDAATMDPYFSRVEREVNVVQVPAELAGANAAVVRRGAERLGWRGDYLYRNVRGCVGSGVCAYGCPTNAKQHAGIAYVTKAWDAGAVTYTRCRARRVLREHGRAAGVLATTAQGARLTVLAPIVIVAAGTIHTPALLAASGVRSPELGRNLSIHPCSAAFALMPDVVEQYRGVPQSYCVDEFAADGLMLEGIAGPPEYIAMSLSGIGPEHRELMLNSNRLASHGLMVSDTSRGSVHRVGGRTVIRYDLNRTDTQLVHRGLLALAELFWAAGAERVLIPLNRVPELRDGDSGPLERIDLQPREVKAMAFHPLGTARAGADPAASVVDPDLQVHGLRRRLCRRRLGRAQLARRQPTDNDHGAGHAARLPPARPRRAGGGCRLRHAGTNPGARCMNIAEAVFPSVAPDRGHYESFYLRAVDPASPRAIWLRHTVHQRPGEPATASLWVTLFDAGKPPRALKQTVTAEMLGEGEGDWIRVGLASFGPGRARGRAVDPAGEREAEWELAFTGAEEPLRHLPRPWMYTAPVPRTKTESPCPQVFFSGRFAIDGEQVELDGWPGMVGHNWGAEHAERWLWLNGLAFEDADAWFDVVIGRIRVGPLTTPWLGNGAVLVDGVRHRLGGMGQTRSITVSEQPDGAAFVLRGPDGVRVEGEIRARPQDMVGWRYADPEGGEHHALNSSIASVELEIRVNGDRRTLHSPHGGVYELGTRETDHGIAVQPYGDGLGVRPRSRPWL